ncbi:MAG: type II toxin-antitoxin system HipA family toxin [Steroidobacteraceae bacterium]|jgi:serine/threonine-protein kinase HipA
MNGELVGEWTTLRTGTPLFRYTTTWQQSPHARALSLSMPITADLEVRGTVVGNYFDNLLPDNPAIRRRIRERFGTRSTQAFDLLEAIGRDCVGAVQLLPIHQEPISWNRVEATRLNDAEMEQLLQAVPSSPPLGHPDGNHGHEHDDDFRISIAGAQEKTALLSMGGAWYRPHGATPTTHILKLPLGIVGNFRGDFSDSVENEWLCVQLLREFGLPIADADILTYGKQTVLSVKRFDRRWIGATPTDASRRQFAPVAGQWIARLPQEDFCQATGRSPTEKCEADGGPTGEEILEILEGSESRNTDRANFVLAQLAFWLLAATDGHAKNFSIFHHAGGAFGMTPLYDVLSAWPVIGRGANQLPIQDAKLAMAIRGKSRHYRLREIHPRHWHELAIRIGLTGLWDRMRNLVESADAHVMAVKARLPSSFPERVIDTIAAGVKQQSVAFIAAAPPASTA